jgi:hypothetical protein
MLDQREACFGESKVKHCSSICYVTELLVHFCYEYKSNFIEHSEFHKLQLRVSLPKFNDL